MTLLPRPAHLRCNHLVDPLGIHDAAPRLSWKLGSDGRRGARQTAYRILVSSKRGGAADLWDSRRVKSDATTQITYGGPPLASRQRAWWRVQSWDERGRRSESAAAFWEAGLLAPGDWSASWIGSSLAGGPETGAPSPCLRTLFNIGKKLASARLYASALGLFEFHLNGQRVGRDVFTPGWTDYTRRVQYESYDVTALLRPGANAAGAVLGDGWYCGHIGWCPRQYYGDRPRLLAQLVLTFADGTTETVVNDGGWKSAPSAILESDLMHGETHDARREMPGWDLPAFDDEGLGSGRKLFASPPIEISPPPRAGRARRPGAETG